MVKCGLKLCTLILKSWNSGYQEKNLIAAQIWAQIWQNQNILIMTELEMAIYKVIVGPGL